MAYPKDYKYTKEHEWIHVQDGIASVGIIDYAQQSLGNIVFLELTKPGDEVIASKSLGTVETLKAISDLYAPVYGPSTEINQDLSTTPEKVNGDAHSAWMIKMKLK